MNIAWLVCILAIGIDPPPLTIDSALLTTAEQAEVPAQDAGQVVEFMVREGDVVAVGASLARLDDASAMLSLAKANIELERAKMFAGNDIKLRAAKRELEFANSEFERAQHSEKKLPGSVSAAERDRLRLQCQRAELEVAQAEFDLVAAKLAVDVFESDRRIVEEKLRRRRIVSPISGTVVAVPKRLGEWVEPGQTVIRVLATHKLRVEFFLKAAQATKELSGKPVRFSMPGSTPDAPEFAGNIAFVSPEVDPLNGQVRVWAEIEDRDGQLRPGLTGTLTILR